MVQPITPALEALLVSRLRAGPERGFRGRIAIGTAGTLGGCYGLMDTGTEGGVQADMIITPGSVSTRWQLLLRSQLMPAVFINVHHDNPTGGSVVKTLQLDADDAYLGNYSPGPPVDTLDISALDFGGRVYVALQIDADGTAHAKLWAFGDTEPGAWQMEGDVDFVTSPDYTGPTLDRLRMYVLGDDVKQLEVHELRVWVDGVEQGDPFDDFQRAEQDGFGGDWSTSTDGFDAAASIVCRVSRPPLRISIDRTRRLAAAQLDADFENEDLGKGWYTGSEFVPNAPVQAFMWYGDPANEVCVFTGLVDRVSEHRDPRTVSITARSRMKWLIEQVFIATGSQDPEDTEATPVLTEDNGVYTGQTIEYIVADILDRGGWPTADRVIAATGITIESFTIPDLTSWAEAITGPDRLSAVAGFDFWEDELGVIHFEPSPLTEVSEPAPDYTFEAGIDIMALDHETDDVERKTRLRVTGPMTSVVAAWKQTWATTVINHPVGAWYYGNPDRLRVIDSLNRYMYTLQQSDRTIVSRRLLEDLDYYPLGLSGDPADPTIFWVLVGNWVHGGNNNARIKKYDATSFAVLDTYVLPDGQWTDIKSDGSFLWLTNFATDRLYKRDITDGSAINSWAYPGHPNPTGMYLNGTTIGLFFNGESRFRLVSTSAPGTITGTQSTAGTSILGGEIDSDTGTDLYAVAEAGTFGAASGHVWKFSLATEVVNDVSALATLGELEDALGEQSGIAPRLHDIHLNLDAHPFEIRLLEVQLKVVTSPDQAQAAAEAMLIAAQRLRRQLDVAWVGNPAVQINDVLEITDPVSEVTNPWVLDTYRAEMTGGGLYVGSGSLLPWESPVEVEGDVEDPGDEEEGGGDEEEGGGGPELGDEDWNAVASATTLNPSITPLFQVGDPGFGLDSDGLGNLSKVTVSGSVISITADKVGSIWETAFLDSNFAVTNGVVEAEIEYPMGMGVWPAFWELEEGLLTTPPEYDILEAYPGANALGTPGEDYISATVHYGGAPDTVQWDTESDNTGEWHTYRLVKATNNLKFYFNGVLILESTNAANVPMRSIMNLALGATGYRTDGTTPTQLVMRIRNWKVWSHD